MTRSTRTAMVVLVAVVTAGTASFGVYRAITQIPVREIEIASTFVVAAARPIPIGSRLTADDLKLVAWPARTTVPGSFAKIESVVDRGVIAPVLENEPVTDAKLAPVDAGAGLAPTIPTGMRAISVQVNEVIGVAGFVTPGTRVDVLVTLKAAADAVTRVVVSNAQVLTAGTRYEQDQSKAGEAIPSSVVTLLLQPHDAERVVLAASEGQLMLALRNPLDLEAPQTDGTRTTRLFGETMPDLAVNSLLPPPPPVRRKVVAAEPPPPPPPAAVAAPYRVETIRAAKRAEETVRTDVKESNQ